jgi:four helix bundle protein
MPRLAHANSYRDLLVYQKCRALSREIFILTKDFPREEMYSLTDQVRRSSRSVGAQIYESWAKRRYEKYFVSKLTDADGEQQETQHWIETALDCGYISNDQADGLLVQCAEIGRLLGGMMAKAELFCNPSAHSTREEQSPYPAEYLSADH